MVALSLSSCGWTASSRDVASVNDRHLDRQAFAEILDSSLYGELVQVNPIGGFTDAYAARDFITAWISVTAISDAGIGADADRAATADVLRTQFASYDEGPEELQEFLIDNEIIGSSLGEGAVTRDELLAILSAADADVDSRYGAWTVDLDAQILAVVPLG